MCEISYPLVIAIKSYYSLDIFVSEIARLLKRQEVIVGHFVRARSLARLPHARTHIRDFWITNNMAISVIFRVSTVWISKV